MATTQPIRNKHQVCALANYYLRKGQIRNHVLFILGIYTALRISDLLRLRWDDVYDFKLEQVRKYIEITEHKTYKTKTVALNKQVIKSLTLFAASEAKPERFLIENPCTRKAISRVQAYRLIRTAAEEIQFENRVSCHSLRKTFGYHAWKSGVSPAVIMEIFNHNSLDVTRRYLGITQDDKNAVYLSLDLMM